MEVFEKEPLERLKFVIQTGGRSPKVKMVVSGLESFIYGAILFGKLPLTKAGMCLVFTDEENGEYRGYIKMVDGLAKKFKPEPEDVGTHFSDWYTMVGA